VLRLLSDTPNGADVIVSWPSAAGVFYVLERSTDLTAHPSFTPVVTNFSFDAGTMSFTDTDAASAPWLFYRIRIGN
jgi:hypothetical protein